MSTVYFNNREYQTQPLLSETEGFILATSVSGAILSPLAYIGKPFLNQLKKEEPQNQIYKDCFKKALDISGLKDKGVSIKEAQKSNVAEMYRLGKNAAFDPKTREVIINTDKISVAGFHELGHALNALKSKYGVKFLAKMRGPGYAIAGLMEYFAIFSRKHPKGAKRSFTDVVEDNCGKIAFIAMLPVVAEEAIASIRGIKLAKAAGIPASKVKNLKKLYAKALATYGSKAVLGALAVFVSRKIMDYYTRPRPVETSQISFFG